MLGGLTSLRHSSQVFFICCLLFVILLLCSVVVLVVRISDNGTWYSIRYHGCIRANQVVPKVAKTMGEDLVNSLRHRNSRENKTRILSLV